MTKRFSRKAMSDSSPPLEKGRQSGGCSPTAQAYPAGKADTLRRKSLSHPAVPAAASGATDLVPRLYHTLFSCFYYRPISPHVNVFAALRRIFVAFARFFRPRGPRFCTACQGKTDKKRRPGAGIRMNMQKAGEDPEILPRAVPLRFQPSSG